MAGDCLFLSALSVDTNKGIEGEFQPALTRQFPGRQIKFER